MDKKQKMHELRIFAAEVRLETLKVIKARGFGHVGGSMSLADAMAVLYGDVMNVDPKNPTWPDRDEFVLSKGHGGPVMYATLGLKGYYPIEEAYTLNQPHTKFPSHTDHLTTPGVELTTGSLGQGISEAVGAALGKKVQKLGGRVYVAVGDGECDEGQVWEAAEFAAHYKLDNLTCIVDVNGMQLDGPTDEIMGQGKGLAAKFDAFGWKVFEVEKGNEVEPIWDALQEALKVKDAPTAIVLHTHKGLGATFAEVSMEHSSQPSPEKWAEAIEASEKQLSDVRNEKV